jgi:hypothetical protein
MIFARTPSIRSTSRELGVGRCRGATFHARGTHWQKTRKRHIRVRVLLPTPAPPRHPGPGTAATGTGSLRVLSRDKPRPKSRRSARDPRAKLLLMPTVEHQLLIAEQVPPSASSASVSAILSANVNSKNVDGIVDSESDVSASSTPRHVGDLAPHPRPARPESPLAHARRSASPNHVPRARIETVTYPTANGTGSECYRLSIALPRPGGALLASEMITVSVRRGGRLAVVADAWHLEHDCE